MKKSRFLLVLLPALAFLTACKGFDYNSYVSETRSDIFIAETEDFSVSLSCITREYPYLSDGIKSPLSDLIEFSLTTDDTKSDYEIYLIGEHELGGDMTYRTYAGDFFYSQSVDVFPKESVSLRIVKDGDAVEITATSVKNEETITPDMALGYAVENEKELIDSLTQNGSFEGEFYVRLLRRDGNYYYVGIVDRNGGTLSLLLDGQTGEVLARRESR